VSEPPANSRAGIEAPSPSATAGALLRAAREAAGLPIDAVAQQLKLAPRQVTALEEDDYTHLPGRTFVRGFVRNYARFLRLDADTVLGALPAGAAAPALAAPTLQQTAPTMGELPVSDHARPAVARWVIPLTLAAIVIAAGLYEWLRPASDGRPSGSKGPATVTERPAPPASGASPASPTPDVGTPPPNPVTSTPPPPPPSVAGTPLSNPLAPTPSVVTTVPAGAATPKEVPAANAIANAVGAHAADASRLVLAFRDYSWTEVKDRNGRVLVSRMNSGGTEQAVTGAPPLELVIGNAADVSVIYNGQPVDLAPHTRQNVARFTLP
jgi:cytoskeleton protein RodZ